MKVLSSWLPKKEEEIAQNIARPMIVYVLRFASLFITFSYFIKCLTFSPHTNTTTLTHNMQTQNVQCSLILFFFSLFQFTTAVEPVVLTNTTNQSTFVFLRTNTCSIALIATGSSSDEKRD